MQPPNKTFRRWQSSQLYSVVK